MIPPNAGRICAPIMETVKQPLATINRIKESTMWTKPQATEMRFGFEVTMYVCNR